MRIRKFSEKLAYVFGGSQGIGLELARELFRAGARVVLFSRSPEKLAAAKSSIEVESSPAGSGRRVEVVPLDVTDARMVRQELQRLAVEIGVPEIVINNVGRARPGYFEEISEEQFSDTISTNLSGAWHTLSFLLPLMKARGGYVVNVSSMVGFVGVFGYADYAASKFGLIGLTEVLRSEYRRYGISFSVLCPPDTLTPGFEEENRTKPPETVAASAGVKAAPPSAVARSCLRGMRKGTFIITTGFTANMVWFLKRHMPGLLFRIMDSDVNKGAKTGGERA